MVLFFMAGLEIDRQNQKCHSRGEKPTGICHNFVASGRCCVFAAPRSFMTGKVNYSASSVARQKGGRVRHREGQTSIIGTPATGDLLRSGQVAGQSESEVRVALPWSRQAQAQFAHAPKPTPLAGISPLAAVSKARRGCLRVLQAAVRRDVPPLQPLSLAP